jgi:murein DD-endopeptidase MepM/ murein hydrolase activator NlpD
LTSRISAIVTSTAPISRLARLSLGVAALAVLSLGVVGAFGVSPDTQIEGIERRAVSETLELSTSNSTLSSKNAQGVFWREEQFQKGDSLLSVLSKLQVDDPELVSFLQSSIRNRTLPPPSSVRTFATATAHSGTVQEMRWRGDSWEYSIAKQDSGYTVVSDNVPGERRVVMQSGKIDSSLFAATDSVGIPDSIAADFAELFSGEVDLHRDIRRGDRFAVVYEMIYANGSPIRSGRIIAAEFLNQGRELRAVFFESPDGSKDYFTPSGRSVRQTFLRSPLEFSRVTSGFSASRFHPVLQIWRAHRGTDYGAPIGTRVRSTADGVIVFAGWQNGYGKVVEIRHNGNYTTRYGHLSEFSGQAKKGTKVEQGTVIGFVGMTGLASGPHLHYEFHVNGTQADPQSSVPEQGHAIPAAVRDEFLRTSTAVLSQLKALRGVSVTSAD